MTTDVTLFEQKLAEVLAQTDLPPQLCAPVAAALTGNSPRRTFYVPAADGQPEDWWFVLASLNLTLGRVEKFPQLVSVNNATVSNYTTAVSPGDILSDAPESNGTKFCSQPELVDAVIPLGGDHIEAYTENDLPRLACDLTLFQPGEAFWMLYPIDDAYDGCMFCYTRTQNGWLEHAIAPTWPTVTDSAGNQHDLGAVICGMMAMLP